MTAIRVGDPPPRPGPLARLFPALFPGAVPEPGAVIVDATGHTWTWGHGRWLPTWDSEAAAPLSADEPQDQSELEAS